MTAHQTATLIIRLLGVVWFLTLISHLTGLAIYIDTDAPKPGGTFIVVLTLVQVLGCAALWLFPATIAAKLLPSSLSPQPRPASAPIEWQTLGFACIGLWELSRAVPDVMYWMIFANRAARAGIDSTSFTPQQVANMYATGVEILLGLGLLLGARGFANLVFRLRTAGLRTDPGEKPSGAP